MTIDLGDYINGIPMGAMAPGSSGGGGGETGNYVTLDTTQTIEGYKTFTKQIAANGGVRISEPNAAHASYVGFSVGGLPDSTYDIQDTHVTISQTNHQDIGRSMELGVRCQYDAQQNNCYITAPSDATDFFINDYYDGSSSNGTADRVVISGPLYNKLNSIEYPVLNSSTGVLYQALTNAEYTALETKSENTMYRITDTGKVYLGETDISGGGGAVMTTQAGLGLGAENTGYVGTTTVTVTNPDEEGA